MDPIYADRLEQAEEYRRMGDRYFAKGDTATADRCWELAAELFEASEGDLLDTCYAPTDASFPVVVTT